MKLIPRKNLAKSFFHLFLILAGMSTAHAGLLVTLETSHPLGAAVGAQIKLVANAHGSDDAIVAYQFSVRTLGGEWQLRRDFDILPSFTWATLDEGVYELRVNAVNLYTAETADETIFLRVYPSATVSPTVTETQHPLVALYSAPRCLGGVVMVRFRPLTGGA